MTSDLSLQKKALRRDVRLRRQQFVQARMGAAWAPPQSWQPPKISSGMVVSAYCPMGPEADPAALIVEARSAGAAIALPRIDQDGLMRFYLAGADMVIEPDCVGIPAPAGDAAIIDPDIILLPLLAFDRSGGRLGQGRGYYDRTIAMIDSRRATPRARRIGVAWSVQEVDQVPRDAWDVALDGIVTEKEWIVP